MNLVQHFWQKAMQGHLEQLITASASRFRADTSKLVAGEGDSSVYGAIEYFDSKNRLVATRAVDGAASDETEFTVYGKALLIEEISKLFDGAVKDLGGFTNGQGPTFLAIANKGKTHLLTDHDPQYPDRIFVNANSMDEAIGQVLRKNPKMSFSDISIEQISS